MHAPDLIPSSLLSAQAEDPLEEVDAYLDHLRRALDLVDRGALCSFVGLLVEALAGGREVFIFGNGGSAANASHITVDFAKGATVGVDRRFRWRCLNDNMPLLTAYANDVDYAEVFVLQLRGVVAPGDLVIALSGSGDSENVIRAARYAREQGATVVGICAYGGGRLKTLAHLPIHLPMYDMQVAEDMQLVIGHAVMRAVARAEGLRGAARLGGD